MKRIYKVLLASILVLAVIILFSIYYIEKSVEDVDALDFKVAQNCSISLQIPLKQQLKRNEEIQKENYR